MMGIADEYRFLTFLRWCSILLSASILGAFIFIHMLYSHDPLLKDCLVTLNWVFYGSSISNFLGLTVAHILDSRHEYLTYQKFSIIIGTTASFLFMLHGYGLLLTLS